MTTPLFIRFCNGESAVSVALSLSKLGDEESAKVAAQEAETPHDMEGFRKELIDAVNDLISGGLTEEFKAFADHYMEPSLSLDSKNFSTPLGENISATARIKDSSSTWMEGFICLNLCLYIKAFGLENLKKCRVCGKYFDNKGKWAVYCSDVCKKNKPSVPKVVKEKEKPLGYDPAGLA